MKRPGQFDEVMIVNPSDTNSDQRVRLMRFTTFHQSSAATLNQSSTAITWAKFLRLLRRTGAIRLLRTGTTWLLWPTRIELWLWSTCSHLWLLRSSRTSLRLYGEPDQLTAITVTWTRPTGTTHKSRTLTAWEDGMAMATDSTNPQLIRSPSR